MNRKIVASYLLLAAVLFSSITPALAFDEGMFAPGQISSLPLKKLGFKIKAEDIYNPNGGGLSEAIVRLDSGCSAELVSAEGLILTNHHCAFDGLVKASTPERDLVETGFNAGSRAGEIPAEGFTMSVTNRVEDVTAKIKAGTENLSGAELNAAYQRNIKALTDAEQAKAPKGSMIAIQMVNNGYYFYLYQTTKYEDIRIVYAPPRNIGVFGGDPDNFEWTRHTGDFTFLRAYTAPDGSSAKFSKNNVPYKPKRFLTINIGGLKENDLVWVMGYPGGTTRYRESWSIDYAEKANFPFLERWLSALSDSYRAIGAGDENKRIAFQSDIASWDNSRKAFGGGHLQLKRVNAVGQRKAEEAKLAAWIAADANRQKKYGNVIADIKKLSEETNATQNRDVVLRRFPDPTGSMPVFSQVFAAIAANKMLNDTERAAKLEEIKKAYADREPAHETAMLKFFLKEFDALPAVQKFKTVEDMFGSLKGQARREAEAKFVDTIVNGEYSNPERVAGLYGPRTMEFNETRERILGLARGVVEAMKEFGARNAKFGAAINGLRLSYMNALTEMKGGVVYPDANFTQRFSYGNVKGYQSREAEFRTPFTTLRGMIEKDTGVKPFDAPQKLIALQNAGDFGRYGSNGSVGVNFLSSTDIIGGNSGSPLLNANGEQVGLCFDGNFEGLGNDFYYDKEKNRTISVDIRYVLFITEKFGGAKWVVDELKIVGGPKG